LLTTTRVCMFGGNTVTGLITVKIVPPAIRGCWLRHAAHYFVLPISSLWYPSFTFDISTYHITDTRNITHPHHSSPEWSWYLAISQNTHN